MYLLAMETKDYIYMAIGLINTLLIIQQNRQMAKPRNPPSVMADKDRLNLLFHRYWPMGIMTLILIGTWMPYVIGKLSSTPATEHPVAMTAWVLNRTGGSPIPTGVSAIVGSTQFAKRYADKYDIFIFVRIVDDTVDENSDHLIDKSSAFQMLVGGAVKIDVPFSVSTIARFNVPRLVCTYLAIIPKGVDPSEITTLGGIGRRGGYILEKGTNGPAGP